MKCLTLILFVAVLAIPTANADGGEWWGYEESTGEATPDQWGGTCSDGTRQSPIDIKTDRVKPDKTLKRLNFVNYNRSIKMVLVENTGQTLYLNMSMVATAYPPHIWSEGKSAKYILKQAHFHWPSEHTVNGENFPLELHLVHLHETKGKDDIRVVAVMFDDINGQKVNGNAMNQIISNIGKVQQEDTETRLKNLIPNDLLPHNVENYIRYAGSLTTPPCAEVVEFFILTETVYISTTDLAKFKTLLNETPNDQVIPISTNRRPVQNNNSPVRMFGNLGKLSGGYSGLGGGSGLSRI